MPIYISRWFEVTDNSTEFNKTTRPHIEERPYIQYSEKNTLKVPHEKFIDDIVTRCISAK